jgi:hypothetical protein
MNPQTKPDGFFQKSAQKFAVTDNILAFWMLLNGRSVLQHGM